MLSLNFFCALKLCVVVPVLALFLKREPQKQVSAPLEWSVGVRDIWALAAMQLITSLILVSQRDHALKFLKPPAVHPALIRFY